MLFADLLDELGGKGLSAVLGLILGGLLAWIVAYWRRRHLRHKVLHGDARDTVVIHHHLVETEGAARRRKGRRPTAMRDTRLRSGKKNWTGSFPTHTLPPSCLIAPWP